MSIYLDIPGTRIPSICCCTDPGCPVPHGSAGCVSLADVELIRIDDPDESRLPMCYRCADDAMDSGIFYMVPETEED